ncbi:MAG: FKBP-type peptidyl-prolyl cis-trans isomerase [Candidatus Sericytochromatia bacterium]|nr:FKBP-type peptidyl-prolyl cis-trans isomerase [Candidatus Sericytochromatia bacterium]
MRHSLYQLSRIGCPVLTALSLSLGACTPSETPPTGIQSPVVMRPAPRPAAAPLKPRSMKLRVKIDASLLRGFGIQQLNDCVQAVSDIENQVFIPDVLTPEQSSALQADGITVTEEAGQTLLSFTSTLQEPGAEELGLEFTLENLPVGTFAGRTTLRDSAETELGFLNYTLTITEGAGTTVDVNFSALEEESGIASCPKMGVTVSGATLVEAGGDIIPAVLIGPSAEPTPTPATEPPVFGGFSPSTGYPLTQVTITGSNLDAVTAVRFGALPAASFNRVSATEITARVPNLSAPAAITLINAAGEATSVGEFTPLEGARRIYIKPGGTGDGSSWVDALGNLAIAMAAGRPGDELWVAAGTYTPTSPGGSRLISFVLTPGITVLGGFNGTETLAEERDWEANPTILSGDLNGNDIYGEDSPVALQTLSDNSFHILRGGQDAMLDGFTIRGGTALSSPPRNQGGGMLNSSNPTLRNLIFENNTALFAGGGMANINNASPSLENVTFRFNDASSGGGMYNGPNTNVSMNQVTFFSNAASQGGGLFNEGASPSITLSSFANNSGRQMGGGMCNRRGASPTLMQVVMTENVGGLGGAMYNNESASPSLAQVVIGGNFADNGGGIYNYNGSSPTLEQVTVEDNQATFVGGGMYNYQRSSPSVHRSAFVNNVAGAEGGGIMNRSNSNPEITNVLIYGNQSSRAGGMGNFNHADPVLRHVTMYDNQAEEGAEMFNTLLANPQIFSSIIWNDNANAVMHFNTLLQVTSSLIKGLDNIEHTGFGNININPQFVDYTNAAGPDGVFMTADDGLRLSNTSPARNFGWGVGMPTLDIVGLTRETPPEMGAYEGDYETVLQPLGITDIEEGTGLEVEAGDIITVAYVGTVENSGTTLDSSNSFTFTIGVGGVIPGWDQGLIGMKAGGTRQLVIPPHLGYGDGAIDLGYDPASNLIFVINLLDVQKP